MFRTLSLAVVVHLGASLMILPTFCASAAAAPQQNPAAADKLSDADLEELLAPIALYPDPLLANVLTASCYPDELAAASKAGGKEATIDAADWEPSVKAVAKIPDALKMLTDYPEWTTAVGEAFILQSSDVMAAVQRLRARAYANGALATTEQQVVSAQQDTIIIQPAQPDVIYVPSYQPSVVYVDHYDSGDVAAAGVIGFGLGVATAAIIANNVDCDWWGGGCHYGGWGGSYHSDIDIETGDINIGTGDRETNIGTGDRNRETNVDRGDRNRETNVNRGDRTNNIKNNGNSWKPNSNKLNSSLREGKASSLNNYKGAGSGQRNANARVPNRSQSDRPIASQRPAPRPSNVNRQSGASASNRAAASRPASQQTKRPSSMNSRASSAPKAKPSVPPASARPPAARGTGGNPPRNPSAYNSSSRSQSASRGTSSRSNSASRGSGGGGGRSGGASRGGGGRGGGGRGGGRR